MTSMSCESVATILCTAKQTRFHIDSPNHGELDIDGLSITVKTSDNASTKAKAKRGSDGVELLSNARLRLKQGQRYALVGQNGTGKSTLLKAIADKLIPGIPEETRVTILQQTRLTDEAHDAGSEQQAQMSVVQQVIDRATARDTMEQEIQLLSRALQSADAQCSPVKALRALKHERLQKHLFVLDKNARLRSGARGMQARKALVAHEKLVAQSQSRLQEAEADLAAETIEAETQEATDLLAELQLQVEPQRMAEMEARAKKVLGGLGFSDQRMEQPVGSMSGGWHMRASLAAALLQETDLLMLDEPTNFLDLLAIIWLQRYLCFDKDTAPTLIVVSHDRDFVTGLCTDLLVLRDRQITAFHGDLAAFEASQAERKLWLRNMKEAHDRQRAHVERTIQQNLKVGRANDDMARIRQAKSRQKRLDDRWGMQVNARGGRFKLNRDLPGYHASARNQLEVAPEERPVVIVLPEPPDLRFPGSLLSLDDASFCYPGAPRGNLVLDAASLTVAMGDRIGILGLNGSGKSTLLRLLVQEARPTSGVAASHPRLRLGYYSQHAIQHLKALGRAEPSLTALALLAREAGSELSESHVRGLLSQLGLPGRLASHVPLHRLSGGQLVRCQLARLFWRRPHCLVLDEVSTHLDYETVTALRIAIHHWEGAVVLVSHDRWFMRGAIEASFDDQADLDTDRDSLHSQDQEDEPPRRRVVYRLHAGKLAMLDNGVDQFERLMEKKAQRLLRG
ncbi:hypothetical protein CDD82_5819 [Ophiocordyceps australis]|uniref:ABC transporter domain-containing protein n=1 Tax=Ophiocordyceps australis TaxID=1399860 RepID=A0A2C5ZRP0_9HYPO|nr:hypothetical protein CDD82_5819 [Ophiocordyceps australis]